MFHKSRLAAAFACSLFAAALFGTGQAVAQVAPANPTVTNVIPDGGTSAVQGRITAIDAGARTLSITQSSGTALPLEVPAEVSLSGLSVGDHVSAHYSRSVVFVVGTPQAGTPRPTETVSQAARAPGGIGLGAMTIVGRVVKVDGPGTFDIVNVDGGAVYTVRATDPARVAALTAVKVGDSVTVSIGALTLTSIARCSMFGLVC